MVKRHTLVTNVLRSMPMLRRDVMRMAATNPPRHRLTTGPARRHSPSVLHDKGFGIITCQ